MRSEICEKLSVFCAVLFGLATASAGPATFALGGAAAVLTLPSILEKLRQSGPEPQAMMKRLEFRIAANYRDWARNGGDITDDQIPPMEAALAAVLPRLALDPRQLMEAGRDNSRRATIVLTEASIAAPGDFGSEIDPQQRINRGSLHGLVVQTLAALDGDPIFEATMQPWFQREVLADLKALTRGQTEIRADNVAAHGMLEEILRRLPPTETEAATEAGIPESTLIELAARIASDVTDLDQARAELTRAVDIAIEVQNDSRRGNNTGAFVEEVLRRMAALSATGHYAEAALEADRAFAEWESAEEDRRQGALARGVRILDAGVKQDILRRDAASAAKRLVRILDLEIAETERFAALWRRQHEWYVRGRDKGLNLDLDLKVSIELARIGVERANNCDERGAALNIIGLALSELGQRETDTERLEEAVDAYNAALEEYKRDRVPLDWAGTQNNLGNALLALGLPETGTERLEQAVDAFRDALEERPRDREPYLWAQTQNNLGNALASLGQRESGTERLEQAVNAYNAALEVYTRDRVPRDWAMIQNNLGNALRSLGQRESGTARLEQAVDAFNAALEEIARDRIPLQWAGTQNNLGNALRTLGECESGTERLEQAIDAFNAALEEITRDRVPFQWAQTQENLAIAFFSLFQKTNEQSQLHSALDAVDAALEVFRESQAAFYIEKAERLRAEIIDAMGVADD